MLFLDCEDAVPANAKAEARTVVTEWVPRLVDGGSTVVVRVNPVGSEWFVDDIRNGLPHEVSAVVIPKIERLSDLDEAAAALDEVGLSRLGVFAGIETALGVADARLAAGPPPGGGRLLRSRGFRGRHGRRPYRGQRRGGVRPGPGGAGRAPGLRPARRPGGHELLATTPATGGRRPRPAISATTASCASILRRCRRPTRRSPRRPTRSTGPAVCSPPMRPRRPPGSPPSISRVRWSTNRWPCRPAGSSNGSPRMPPPPTPPPARPDPRRTPPDDRRQHERVDEAERPPSRRPLVRAARTRAR